MLERMVACASHSPLIHGVDGGTDGTVFLETMDRLRQEIKAFDPTLVVMFGPDHRRAFPSIVPAFGVVTAATGLGDWGTPTDPYEVPSDQAIALAEHMLAQDFDAAVVSDIELDHGFGQTYWQLFGALGARPTIPVFVNCASPPLPGMRRALEFGREVGQYFAHGDEPRVLFLASGGLSHDPPSPGPGAGKRSEAERMQYIIDHLQEGGERIQPDWDREFLRVLNEANWQALAAMSTAEVARAGRGTNEVRTWAAAVAAGDRAVTTRFYGAIPDWITGMAIVASEPAPVSSH